MTTRMLKITIEGWDEKGRTLWSESVVVSDFAASSSGAVEVFDNSAMMIRRILREKLPPDPAYEGE